MSELFSYLSSNPDYFPHGYRLGWSPALIFTHVFADLLVAFSSFSIFATLLWFVRRRPDFRFRRSIMLFGAFILMCGFAQLAGVLTLWQPVYGAEALAKLLAGALAVAASIVLWPLLSKLLALPGPAQQAAAQAAVETETGRRLEAEAKLHRAEADAEARYSRRVTEMAETNLSLAQQLAHQTQIARALSQTSAHFMDLADRTRTGIIHVTTDGVVRSASMQYAALVGVESPDTLVGRTTDEWIVEPDTAGLKAYRRSVLLGDAAAIEMRIRRPDGAIVDVEALCSVSQNGGEPIIVGFVRDISQRKDHEREAEMTRLKLARSNEDLERFASVASHELNVPLRHLRIVLETVTENAGDKLDRDCIRLLEQGCEATERMSTLIKDLLDFSRIGSIAVNSEPVKLGDVLHAAIQNIAVHVNASAARIDIGELPTVNGNAGALIHLWQNLLNNAIRYRSKKPPEIAVAASDVDDGWEIAVTDNGIGVPAEQAERIFEMHTRLHAYKDIPGSGIGLAACRRAAELHGGRIWLDTSYSGGSRFVVWLPKRPADAGTAEAFGPGNYPRSRTAR